MIVISIIILCANVLKSFSYTFPRSSQVKFGYLFYFLVDLDRKKCTEAKTNRSSFQIKRIPIAKSFYWVFCFSFCTSWLMVSTHSPLCFYKSLSPNQHSSQTQVLRCWILPRGSAPLLVSLRWPNSPFSFPSFLLIWKAPSPESCPRPLCQPPPSVVFRMLSNLLASSVLLIPKGGSL